MSIQHWEPATCSCLIEETVANGEIVARAFLRKCSIHAATADANDVYVYNVEQGKIAAAAREQAEADAKAAADAELDDKISTKIAEHFDALGVTQEVLSSAMAAKAIKAG